MKMDGVNDFRFCSFDSGLLNNFGWIQLDILDKKETEVFIRDLAADITV